MQTGVQAFRAGLQKAGFLFQVQFRYTLLNSSYNNLIPINTFGFGSILFGTNPHTTKTMNAIHIRDFFIITDINAHRAIIQAVKAIDTGFYISENFQSFNFKEFSDVLK